MRSSSNFDNVFFLSTFFNGLLRTIRINRVWCYFLVHIFKIKKSGSISLMIIKSLKISFGFVFISLRAIGSKIRFPVCSFQTKKTACNYLNPCSSFSVRKCCGRTDRRTNRQTFSKKFSFFFLIKNIYHVYLVYFSNFNRF